MNIEKTNIAKLCDYINRQTQPQEFLTALLAAVKEVRT